MILVADSGSSKTDWAIVGPSEDTFYFSTEGYNPFFAHHITWRESLLAMLSHQQIASIKSIFYFGAGCDRPENTLQIKDTFLHIFKQATVEIHDDLLGAALGLWQDQQGIAAILGTGTNVGFYDGKSILRQIIPMGYILGDHGSGAVLGKRLLQAAFNNALPESVIQMLNQQYNLNRTQIKQRLYNEHNPNHFLAGFVPFLVKHKEIPSVKQLIQEAFVQFFRYQILPLYQATAVPIRFTGSVAYYFQDILRETGELFSLEIDKIERYPIRLLTRYYQNKIEPIH